ncbi:MAG: DUF5522 domain-containing protein [Candidatus Sumerlaeia bacterium]|nr:DUF5522 domain-containing protein [Candidatus Sumerlaeia bacterium]
MSNSGRFPKLEPGDYYTENGLLVFTAQYHLRRGTCCGCSCRHCPWAPVSEVPAGLLKKGTEEAPTQSARSIRCVSK